MRKCIFLKRIDILGVSEPEITIEGENRIRVKLAGIKNADEARRVIGNSKFRIQN